MDDLEQAIGRDAMAKVRAAGWTPPPPKPEPKRLVTMEESRERFLRVKLAISGGYPRSTAERWWDEAQRDLSNDADNWLVRTVNHRIIEGLPAALDGTRVLGDSLIRVLGDSSWVSERRLLRHFCGEETP